MEEFALGVSASITHSHKRQARPVGLGHIAEFVFNRAVWQVSLTTDGRVVSQDAFSFAIS